MKKRALSKKRAAEAEKEIVEIDMDDKEATPVEDLEGRLPPEEPKQPTQPKEQPEIPTQTGEVNLQEKELEKSKITEGPILDKMMEMFLQLSKERKEDNQSLKEELGELGNKIENTNKRIEENSKKMEEDNQSLSKKMDDMVIEIKNDSKLFREELRNNRTCLLYTSRCV